MYKPRSRPHNPLTPVMLPGVGAAPDADDAGDLGMYSLTKPEASHAIWANPAKNLGTQARRV